MVKRAYTQHWTTRLEYSLPVFTTSVELDRYSVTMKPMRNLGSGQPVICADGSTPGVQMDEDQAKTLPEYQEYLQTKRAESTLLRVIPRGGQGGFVIFPVDILTQDNRLRLLQE